MLKIFIVGAIITSVIISSLILSDKTDKTKMKSLLGVNGIIIVVATVLYGIFALSFMIIKPAVEEASVSGKALVQEIKEDAAELTETISEERKEMQSDCILRGGKVEIISKTVGSEYLCREEDGTVTSLYKKI